MDRKRKPKNPWFILIWLIWSLIAPGCAQFPDHSYADCVTNYSDTPTVLKECKEEVEQRTLIRLRNEERKAEKARCLAPHGVWVVPPGMCTSSSVIIL